MPAHFLRRSRHGTTYFFRRRVPARLREILGTGYICRSLLTSDRRAAVARARAWAVRTDELFEGLELSKKKGAKEKGVRVDMIYRADVLRGLFEVIPAPGEDVSITTGPDGKPTHIEVRRSGSLAEAVPLAGVDAVATRSKPIGDAVAQFLRESGGLRAMTKKNYEASLQRAVSFFDVSMPIESITQAEFARYAQHVDGLPKSRSTKEGYLNALSSLGKWHRQRGAAVPVWSSAGLLAKDKRPPSELRPAWSIDQLAAILTNAASYGKASPEFWVTALVMFTGCRVEEIAQLDLQDDLAHDGATGVHYLRIRGQEEPPAAVDGVLREHRSVKTAAGWRVAPIHSALVKAGAIDYLTGQRNAGRRRPFEVKWSPHEEEKLEQGRAAIDSKWAHKISKWGSAELARLVAAGALAKKPGAAYFHSMRHSFNTHLASLPAELRLDDEQRSLLSGHEHGALNAGTYTKLRNDHNYLSSLIEPRMVSYVHVLNEALERPARLAARPSRGRPSGTADKEAKRLRGRPRKRI
ncbi:MAG: DUF6538 domain-containing protein [Burkholderiales bacterium]